MFNLKLALGMVRSNTINNEGSNSEYFKDSAPTYKRMVVFAENILLEPNLGKRLQLINDEVLSTDKKAYLNGLDRLKNGLMDQFKNETFKTIFQKGNSKLPYHKYSTLPLLNCGGKNECGFFCYSIKSWRHYSPFIRQLMNTIIEREHFHIIQTALSKLLTPKKNKPIVETFRLYVDGDFSSLQLYRNWMNLISRFPDTKFYGYSKSLDYFFEYPNIVPNNYRLNISNGSIYDSNTEMIDSLLAMPFCRGRFVAIGMSIRSDSRKQALQILKNKHPNNKVFMCPGKCGNCTNIGHACGSDRFRNVVIGIMVH